MPAPTEILRAVAAMYTGVAAHPISSPPPQATGHPFVEVPVESISVV
ncbi:hypothetical protein [Actinotalea fermentans]|nr:hypothetical protein [Actinotalea fermentans]